MVIKSPLILIETVTVAPPFAALIISQMSTKDQVSL